MKRSIIFVCIILLLSIITIISINSSTTYGYEIESNNYTLFYKEDNSELKNDIEKSE